MFAHARSRGAAAPLYACMQTHVICFLPWFVHIQNIQAHTDNSTENRLTTAAKNISAQTPSLSARNTKTTATVGHICAEKIKACSLYQWRSNTERGRNIIGGKQSQYIHHSLVQITVNIHLCSPCHLYYNGLKWPSIMIKRILPLLCNHAILTSHH